MCRFVSFIILFILSLCANVFATKSVSLTVQNMTKHDLMANLASDKFVAFKQGGIENTSVDVSENPIRLVLKKSRIPEQKVILTTKDGKLEIATVVVSQQYDYPELRIISNPRSGGCIAALYATRVGGGYSYVIALGNSSSDVSVEQVRSMQKEGKKQIYVPAN